MFRFLCFVVIVTALVLPAIGGQGGVHAHGHSALHEHATTPGHEMMNAAQSMAGHIAMQDNTEHEAQVDCCQADCQCAQHSCHFSLITSQVIQTSSTQWPQDKPVSIAGNLHHAFTEQPYRPPIA